MDSRREKAGFMSINVKVRMIKGLGLTAGIAVPMLGLSSCSSSSEPNALSMLMMAPVILPIAGIYAGIEAEERMQKRERERAEALKAKRKDGPFVELWSNGKKRAEGTYKNTELHGLHTRWWESGQKREEGYYEEGELVKFTSWHENGHKSGEIRRTSSASWYESGQMKIQHFFYDDSIYGYRSSRVPRTRVPRKISAWYENGQRSYEVTCNPKGDHTSAKYWNKNGEEVSHREWDPFE